MNCQDCQDRLPRLLSEDLPAGEREQVSSHLEGCAACKAESKAYDRLQTALESIPEVETAALRHGRASRWNARLKTWLGALAAAALFGTTLWVVTRPSKPGARERPGTDAGRPTPPDPAARVTLTLREEDVRKAIAEIARQGKANVVVAPDVRGTLTLRLDDVAWPTALSAVAKTCNFVTAPGRSGIVRVLHPEELLKEKRWEKTLGDRLLGAAEKEAPKATFDFTDADVRTVIDLIARQAGGNAVISPDVKGAITLSLREVPWTDALDAVVRTLGFAAVRDGSGIVRVQHPDDLLTERAQADRIPRLERAGPGAPRLTFTFRDADVRVILDMIARMSGNNLVIAPEVRGALTLYVNNLPWDDVLDSSVRALGFVAVKGGSGVVRVLPPEEYLKEKR